MSNIENYEAKIAEIQAIPEDEIIAQTAIPIEVYIQEAENLCKWCQADKSVLKKANLDWKIVEDIPIRAGALREAVSRWVTQRFTKQETGKIWTVKSAELFQLRNLLLHEFRFAYRKNSYIMGRINTIAGSQSYAALIQDLNDLSVLGKNNPAELKAVGFDMANLDKAAALAKEMADLLASTTLEADYSAAKRIRDQAFTYLKFAVDELCNFGQYLFWKDDTRKRGYSSTYLRRIRKRRSKEESKAGNSEQVTAAVK